MQNVLFIIVLGLLAFYFFWYPQLKRSGNLKKIANNLNIPFYPKGDDSLYDHLEYFYLFSLNSKSRITNMLHQEDKETELAFFDFTFEIGAGGSGTPSESGAGGGVSYATEHKQSVVYFCSPKLDLPQFVLRPEKIYHQSVDLHDIDFSSHTKFSDDYLLQGNPEKSVRKLFNNQLLNFFESKPGLCVEGGANQMLFYRLNERISPNKLSEFLEEGMQVLSKFTK
tara:strand:- start:11 stop:685 length:675 start_codon:yes stop_codon:yes gene_type:complete